MAALLLMAPIVAAHPSPGAAADDAAAFEPNPHPHSVVVDWVDAMLLAIERNPPAPTLTTWRSWIVASAMYDAAVAYESQLLPVGPGVPRPAASQRDSGNRDVAVAHAAHRTLVAVYPNEVDLFDEVLRAQGVDAGSGGGGSPAAVGRAAGDLALARRAGDGSNAAGGFAPVTSELYPQLYEPVNSADPLDTTALGGPEFDPNRWAPLRVPTAVDEPVDGDDPSTYLDQSFLTPHWGAVGGFALDRGDRFRPPPPPLLGSHEPYVDALGALTTGDAAFRSQAAEILRRSATLDDEGRVLAEFWADGPHTWTPPGHWVQIAVGISLRDGHDTLDDARMFMALTGALLDAGIAAWDAKRTYDFVRPITAIRHLYGGQTVAAWAGPGRGTELIDGADWQPYQSTTFVTPPFAEYVSGHSSFSRSAAEVLSAFTGSPTLYDGVTKLGRDYDGDGEEDLLGRHVAPVGSLGFDDGPSVPVVLQWPTLRDAADEAALSRRYGGIHFQDGDLRGRELGRQAGELAWWRAQVMWDPAGSIERAVSTSDAADVGSLGRVLATRLRRDAPTPATCALMGALNTRSPDDLSVVLAVIGDSLC